MGEHRADMVRTLLGHPARDGKAIKKCGLVDVPYTGLATKHAANANALRVTLSLLWAVPLGRNS
jgi:hypothetical protein